MHTRRTLRSRKAVFSASFKLLLTLSVVAALIGQTILPAATTVSAAGTSLAARNLNQRPVTNFDINLTKYSLRLPSPQQLQALDALKLSLNDANVTARWDKKTGSLDTLMDFASAPSTLDPEAAARAFIQVNSALFGITDPSTLRLKSNHPAFGGNLLYFEQTYMGLPVANAGVGVVMDKERRVKMLSGPYVKDINLNVTPALSGAIAVAKAKADLAKFKKVWALGVAERLKGALDTLTKQLGAMAVPVPQLNVFPTPNGARLSWKFFVFSRNPFGMFKYQVDAETGEVLYREDFVRYQSNPLPMTADVYPTYPCITRKLKDEGVIENGPNGAPCGQQRVQLRKFDQSNIVTGATGTLKGTHALITNLSPLRLPFAQAALGTWHFAKDDPTAFEARTNEQAHYGPAAEPASHQDEISQFFYITSLLEYIDYLHVAGDAKHSAVGQGDFPDTYPNQSTPLIGNVHMPNVLAPPTDPTSPTFLDELLGLDNAFSLSLSSREVLGQDIAGQNVIVNPTSYGHGYLLNNLAIDFGVPYHEGMHSISSPIAGLEGSPEGSALNEAQADLWAYTAANNPVLGNYPVNGHTYREYVRSNGRNPDERQYIRHGDSGLSYSQLGTLGGTQFEEHRDGEIFAATGWDLRELMIMTEPAAAYVRPDVISGNPTKKITVGQENWERILLGTIYVLSTFNPDTFVRARDAMIIADQSLYPSNAADPNSPGLHRALIERVFASRELGANAAAPNTEGRQTISTRVSPFVASQGKLAAPASVAVALASANSNRVTWQPVSGAFAYQVLKREIGRENQRLNKPVEGRAYIDGDGSTDGYHHVAFVKGTSYIDNGYREEVFVPRGLKNPVAYEYVVRAMNVNANKQVGASVNSKPAAVPTAVVNVTSKVQASRTAFVSASGKTEFDQTLKNTGAHVYTPVEFRIVNISDPTVTVANADNLGTGRGTSPASFYYPSALATGQVSAPRHLVFNNPNKKQFTFDAVVTARVQVAAAQATRYQPPPTFDANFTTTTFRETFTGVVPLGDTGLQAADGVTYVDVPFTSKGGAQSVAGALTTTTGVDLDLELRDSAGRVIASAGTESANETLTAAIQPNTAYVYRVVGWLGVAQDFQLVSTQTLRVPKTGASASTSTSGSLTPYVRFSVNSLTGAVAAQLLQ
ncbi:MAG TPA: M36 family metallopeptidase [Pyrinomonadaceae bacterium]|nr:M36 family metallopeptidase [Pyrinomonadaceae bacterium]